MQFVTKHCCISKQMEIINNLRVFYQRFTFHASCIFQHMENTCVRVNGKIVLK